MNARRCDVVIIGAGTAGLSARAAAEAAGAKALLVDDGPGGTTCARFGCMPSKLLIAAGDAAFSPSRLPAFGLRLDGRVVVDGPAVMERVRRERDRFVGSVLENVAAIPEAETLRGRARFVGATRLAVGGTEIEARSIVIATGSRPAIPDSLRDLGDAVLTNENVFEIPDLPGSLAVVGAGPLGIELAQAFARLGVRVVVFDEKDAVAGLDDPTVASRAADLLGAEISLKLGVKIEAHLSDGAVEIAWSGRTSERELARFERVLVAAGRPADVDGLSLATTGLELGRHGIPVFDRHTLRCGDSSIFIAGDAAGDRPVLHEAAEEGRIAGRNAALFPRVEEAARQTPLSIVYTDPEVASVGRRWSEIAGSNPAVGEVDLARSGRARVMGRNAGLIRLYADRSGVLLGGAMVGPEVEHLAHLVAWLVQRRMTTDDALALPFYHPTLEESLRAALRDLCSNLETRPRPSGSEYGPGS